MLIEKSFPSGAWQISETIDSHLVTRTYYGYSRKDAIEEFCKEFSIDKENLNMSDNINDFISAYIECALWSSTDYNDEPLDTMHSIHDISKACLQSMQDDCLDFLESFGPLIDEAIVKDASYSSAQAGHDFWLTRNGHGAGFWDRGLGDIGAKLTAASEPYGSFELYIGDDGLIYC